MVFQSFMVSIYVFDDVSIMVLLKVSSSSSINLEQILVVFLLLDIGGPDHVLHVHLLRFKPRYELLKLNILSILFIQLNF